MTRREALDTEAMLSRLTTLLVEHEQQPSHGIVVGYNPHRAREDAESLRRISMTLHRWHELECGTDGGSIQRFIPKRIDGVTHYIVAEQSGYPYFVNHNGAKSTYTKIPDREAGALKRLAAIMSRYPSLTSYVQGDPRGCALYILRPGDILEGSGPDACYTRGLAVYQ